jgi:NitT/TauT family transport system permease protein
MSSRSSSIVRSVVPPAVFGLAFLAVWELAVKAFNLKPYFLAPPSKIWQKFTENIDLVWGAA